jgi:HdeA/HdeB family protein
MRHSIVFYVALVAAPLGVACEKAGVDGHADANKAGTTVGAVPSNSAKALEDYRHQKQTDLRSLDKSITDLEAKEKIAASNAKMDLDRLLPALKVRRDAFMNDLRAIDATGAATWDSTKARLDKEWDDLKAATDKATSVATSAFAATHKPGEMTCADFLALADVEKPKIVYWAEGFNKNGRAIDSAFDIVETDRLVPVLVAECVKTPKESLSKVVQQHPSASKPATAAKPAKMTCEEFVALEDVAKPKVVYWAEGFNKDGKATDAVVDIDETDRLVPTLISECKETPKLTLWQKIKKYF